jgi:non-ribosomal peptide synthetase component F
MFGFHDSQLPELKFGEAEARLNYRANNSSKFDLNIVVMPRYSAAEAGQPGISGIAMEWEYNTDLFDRETISRMLGHFITLLGEVAAAPARRLTALPLLTEGERRLLLGGGEEARSHADADGRCWYELFEEQAARTPDAVALSCGTLRLSYSELDSVSTRLAARLAALGVGPESLVALLSARDAWLFVWMLAVHKAGGAYLPLDPRWPAARLSRIFASSGTSLLISSPALSALAREALEETTGPTVRRKTPTPPGRASSARVRPLTRWLM